MKVYCIDPDGYFTGKTATANPHPFRTGEYLYPAFTVAKAPPAASREERQRWIGDDWIVERRPDAAPQPQPEQPVEQRPSVQQQQAAFLLQLTDQHIADAKAEGFAVPPDWMAYRNTLAEIAMDARDIVRAIPVPPAPIAAPVEKNTDSVAKAPLPSMDDIRAGAKAQVAAMLDMAANAITGATPLAERLSWGPKQDAAKACQAGTATSDQIAMLEAEAAVTGESLDDLIVTILDAAAAYHTASGTIAGLRRTIAAELDACADIPAINTILATAEQKIAALQTGG